MDGRLIKVTNGLGLIAEFSAIGASLRSLRYKGTPLLLEHKDDSKFESCPEMYGKTLGRVAGRIPSDFIVSNTRFQLSEVEEKTCLHGGFLDSMSFMEFDSFIANRPEGNYIIFKYTSPDGENGFPGNCDIKITYFMPVDRNEVTVRLKASADDLTPMNLSIHPYFNLEGEDSVDDNLLMVSASHCSTHEKGSKLPSSLQDVPDYLDFRTPSSIGTKVNALLENDKESVTIDHYYAFDEINPTKPQVILKGKKIEIHMITDYPGVNVYVDPVEDGSMDFINHPKLKKHRSIALEPELYNYPVKNIMLKAGTRFSKSVTYRIIDIEGERI